MNEELKETQSEIEENSMPAGDAPSPEEVEDTAPEKIEAASVPEETPCTKDESAEEEERPEEEKVSEVAPAESGAAPSE